MDNKFTNSLLVMGLIASLVACQPNVIIQPETTVPAPSSVPATETSAPVPSEVPTSQTIIPSPLPAASEAPIEFDCDTAREIAVWDCRALVALFESTHGESWKEHLGWLEIDTPCYWYGVTCEAGAGHVTELLLYDNGLSGSLPMELEDLTHLRVIRMFDNQLSGSLSPWLGRLSSLKDLDLARNQLSGEIPEELGNLTKLTWLNLSGNELSGSIPPQLSNLRQLSYLYLASNRLSGSIPGQLGRLKNLNTLDFSHNQLSGSIPAELVNLANTYWLDLSYNQLSGSVPIEWMTESIDKTSAMSSAPRLWGNQLEGTIPASNVPSTEVFFEGIHFSFPSSVIESVWPQIVSGASPSPDKGWWDSDPAHFSLSFASLSGPAALQRYWGTWLLLPPQIRVYPVAGLEANEFTSPRADALRELLETKPASPTNEIPVLPLINAAQVFRAQVRYLDFQNGSGVRFITQYRQDVGPVTDDEIFYTFQGLTEDGAYYVVASFPLSTDVLPDTVDIESQAFREFELKNYEEYMKEQVDMLDALPSAEFEPDLAMLDQIVVSLDIQPK